MITSNNIYNKLLIQLKITGVIITNAMEQTNEKLISSSVITF